MPWETKIGIFDYLRFFYYSPCVFIIPSSVFGLREVDMFYLFGVVFIPPVQLVSVSVSDVGLNELIECSQQS